MASIIKKRVTLSSGHEADIAIVHVESFAVEAFNEVSPASLVTQTEIGLASARLGGAAIHPVSHQSLRSKTSAVVTGIAGSRLEMLAERAVTMVGQYARAGLSVEALWQDRRSEVPSVVPVPLAHTELIRLKSATLARDEVFANGNHFLFEPREFDTPFEAYGDPVGMVVIGGVMLHPPQVPRACLISDESRFSIKSLSFHDVRIVLPGGGAVESHIAGGFNAASYAGRPVAIARYYGSFDGLTPSGDGVFEVAVVGQYAVAFGWGGRMPIPRTGCVIRFPHEPDVALIHALRSGEALRYSLRNGSIVNAVQSGPRLVVNGVASADDTIFEKEGVFISGAAGDLRQPSPYNWKADWHDTRAARLGAGLDVDGHLFFIAVEGQSTYAGNGGPARGATLHDLSVLMRDCGAIQALHLDGGGSTQLFRPFGGSVLRPGNICRGFEDVEADYDRPIPLGLRLKLRTMDQTA